MRWNIAFNLMYSFHKQDRIFASDLYGRLQSLAYRLAIVNAHTDLPLIFYLLLKNRFSIPCLSNYSDLSQQIETGNQPEYDGIALVTDAKLGKLR